MTVVIAASPAASQREVAVSDLGCVDADPVVSRSSASDALYGRYHPAFSDVRAAIQDVQDGLTTKYAEGLATLMTLSYSTLPVTSPLNWILSIAGSLPQSRDPVGKAGSSIPALAVVLSFGSSARNHNKACVSSNSLIPCTRATLRAVP